MATRHEPISDAGSSVNSECAMDRSQRTESFCADSLETPSGVLLYAAAETRVKRLTSGRRDASSPGNVIWAQRLSLRTACLAGAILTLSAVSARSQVPDTPPVASGSESEPADAAAESISRVSLPTLEQWALQRNPTLVQANAQIGISQGKALQAGLCPNPIIGYSGDQIGAEGTAGEFQGAFIEQQIITAGKLRLSRAKFTQEARQAQMQVAAQQFRVLYSVRAAFYEALVAEQRIAVHQQLFANSQEIVRTLEELVNVGQANQSDLIRARLLSRREQASLEAAQRKYLGDLEELAAVVGVATSSIGALEGQLELDATEEIDKDAGLIYLLTYSPEICFAQAEVVRDRIGLQRERVEPIPNIQLRVESGYNFETDDTVAGLEVGLRLPIFDRNQGTIAQAQFELSRAQAEVRRVEMKLREQFAEAFAEYEAQLLTAKAYRDDILPEARRVVELNTDSFQRRRAAWPQVLDAQRELLQFNDEYLEAALDARMAVSRVQSMFLTGGLEQPPAPTPEGHRDATPKPR